MKFLPRDIHGRQFFLRDFHPDGVVSFIDRRSDLQAFFRCRIGNEVHDNLLACQRSSSPIHSNVTKHAMFNLIPLACSGREVRDGDR